MKRRVTRALGANMRYRKNMTSLILTLLIAMVVSDNAQSSDDKYQPFVQKAYDPKEFRVNQSEFHNGRTSIRIIQAKKVAKNYYE
jgi:hypothetical protein